MPSPRVKRPVPLAKAVAGDSRLAGLKALRDRLAADLDGCGSARDVAALSQRLMDVLEQIDDLGGGVVEKRETALDEFTKRLHDREQSAAHPAHRSRSV